MLCVCLVLFLCASGVAQVSDDWIQVVYEEDFGSDIQFECNSSLAEIPEGSVPERWMFTDLSNEPNGFNSSKYEVADDGQIMTILNVNEEDFGIYHCMLQTPESEWYLVKLGLNVRGPYYEDLWEKYKMNTIIGFSAFFGILIIFGTVILVYKFRYIPPEMYSPTGNDNIYDNPGFKSDFIDNQVTRDISVQSTAL